MIGWFYVTSFAVGTVAALLLVASALRRKLAAHLGGGNDAQRIEGAGELLAVFVIASATVHDGLQGNGVLRDIVACAGFGTLALAASTLAGRLGIRFLFGHLHDELARGNKAAGVVAAAQIVASSLVTSRAISGSDLHGVGLSLCFFVIGQATLLGFVTLFRSLTLYDDAEQVRGENVAAALSYGGAAVAIGIVVGRAVEGDFTGWQVSLAEYGWVLLSLAALWPVRQLFVQGFLLRAPVRLRGGAIDSSIAERRCVGVASLEAVSYVATALAIVRVE